MNMALSHLNGGALREMALPGRVTVYDSTLRDGEQMPGVAFTHDEKVTIASLLADAGVPQIEAGFPAVSPEERRTVRDIAGMGLGPEILALARTCKNDLDAALECDADMVMLFTAASDLHLKHKYRMSREGQLDEVTAALEYARDHGLRFSFSTEDTTRSDHAHLLNLYRIATDMDAVRLGIADTTGCALPGALRGLTGRLVGKFGLPVSAHLHNDFGLALANALACVEGGATAIATTVNGMGERAGNVPTEQLAVALELMYGVDTGIDLTALPRLCRVVSELARVHIPPGAPWVGANAFRHESGIHVAAVLSQPLTYECVLPHVVGRRREITLGKHSGRRAVASRLQSLGVRLSEERLERLVGMVKEAGQDHRTVDDDLLLSMANALARESGGDD